MKNLIQYHSVLRIWISIAVSYLVLIVNANAASLEIHPSVLTALGKRPSFADKMIVIDDVGKGGVDYEFMVSQTQITVPGLPAGSYFIQVHAGQRLGGKILTVGN